MNEIVRTWLDQGILGLVAVTALALAWWKDRQVEHLYRHWLEKADTRATKYHELSTELSKTIGALLVGQDESRRKIDELSRWQQSHREGRDP
jgi:hypothetical protein